MPTDEKPNDQDTEAFFRERAARGDRAAFLDFLDGAGEEPPAEGDEAGAG
ncbi:hypothetical protein [Thalassobaculum sp.]